MARISWFLSSDFISKNRNIYRLNLVFGGLHKSMMFCVLRPYRLACSCQRFWGNCFQLHFRRWRLFLWNVGIFRIEDGYYVSPNRWHLPSSLHGVKNQIIIIIIVVVIIIIIILTVSEICQQNFIFNVFLHYCTWNSNQAINFIKNGLSYRRSAYNYNIKIFNFYLNHLSMCHTYIQENTWENTVWLMCLTLNCNKWVTRLMKYAEPQLKHLENKMSFTGLGIWQLISHTPHPIHFPICSVKVIYLCHKIVPFGT
jgi:hypothetical protein